MWYEDETEPLEDRPPFAMRCIKYIGQLCVMLLAVTLLISSKDYEYRKICDRRDLCYNNCNRIYFPSLLCNDYVKNLDGTDVEINLYGNKFNRFFKFANPAYVDANFDKDAAVTQDL